MKHVRVEFVSLFAEAFGQADDTWHSLYTGALGNKSFPAPVASKVIILHGSRPTEKHQQRRSHLGSLAEDEGSQLLGCYFPGMSPEIYVLGNYFFI